MPRSRAAAQIARASSCGKTTPPATVVGVLDLDERGRRIDRRGRGLDRGANSAAVNSAAAADLGELHAGVGRRAAGLVPDRVALAADDDSSPGRVSTRSATWFAIVPLGSQERGFLAEQRGDALLQPVDGRVLAVLVVADRRGRHRRAHRRRRTGDGVGAQVDHRLSRISAEASPRAPLSGTGMTVETAVRIPRRISSGGGGQPGIATSTGITLATRPQLA